MSALTPPSSSPIRKRGRDDNEDDDTKRWQHNKIHTETHVYTIEMMMNAQRELSRKKPGMSEPTQQEEEAFDTDERQSSYKQSPYWPVITRAR
ncbi:hypothetical protein CANTEDRAFT_116553 [Yamadazyma tenuis ATCC 10573]|uniref:Uncharacterized protein n=1 Tax=Candida tenuis (strain ATCC 10573 / BCRC 21748 / CBS 615 / JCM 9827 / NBRC 10315 / NRRL Y-1498 / VKM Y-70) TaxID=590646 RepID=G3BE91_CANTC|nr:uncharacterized protein CANTEDRAFT_116553 [Yamadazyma tenuis ATCC 10573]EGV60491.1 hypothetical protein CANTEDRAFT_116553 [Yamadazyma tenuis ATCC 10573]